MAMERKFFGYTLLLIIGIFVFCARGYSGQAQSPVQAPSESPLKAVKISNNTVAIELKNDVPVRGVQFMVTGVKVTEVRTTDRTKEFFAKFNEKNGMVLMVSASGDSIAPGNGPVLNIICDKPASASLSGVRIVAASEESKDSSKGAKDNKDIMNKKK
jgi:hypothetical protein